MNEPGTSAQYNIVTKQQPTFYFIGVTTGKSSIMRLFPLWAQELGRPEVVIEGVDLKQHDAPAAYRQAVAQIKYDPLSEGALVTTHKIDLLDAARDLFEYLDPYAELCGEVSSISKLEGRLEGHAKDPITAGLSLDAIIGKDYFGRTGGAVLCFGAGCVALGGAGGAAAAAAGSSPETGQVTERLAIAELAAATDLARSAFSAMASYSGKVTGAFFGTMCTTL